LSCGLPAISLLHSTIIAFGGQFGVLVIAILHQNGRAMIAVLPTPADSVHEKGLALAR
jgi:hypothetical protein